jgi:single-strand DNA-binding protein
MPKSLNKIMLIGNLGRDPELRYAPSGSAVANFSLATTESWKDNDGNPQERTAWHTIIMWGKLAEIAAEYLRKGSKAYIEGRLQYREYEAKDGTKKQVTEIIANDLIMLDSRQSQQGLPEDKDDLPF